MSRVDRLTVDPADTSSIKAALGLLFGSALLILALLAVDWALRAQNVPVRNLRFEGPFVHVTQAELERAVMDSVRTNFFLVDLAAVKARAEAIPWVQKASVRRAWPWDVHVQFQEQRLVARWDEDAFLNDEGRVVSLPAAPIFASALPRLAGPRAVAREVLARYEEARRVLGPAGFTVARFTMTPRRSYEIELDNGLRLVLDAQQSAEKLARFARAYAQTIAPRAAHVRGVDLRYSNGFAVQWRGSRSQSLSGTAIGGVAGEQTVNTREKG